MKVFVIIKSRDEKRTIGFLEGEQVSTTKTGLIRVSIDGKVKCFSAKNVTTEQPKVD